MKEKKIFEEIKVEIVRLDEEDIIATSGGDTDLSIEEILGINPVE